MTRRKFKNIPLPDHVWQTMKRYNAWDGGQLVIGVVYTKDDETARAEVGIDDRGGAWAGRRLRNALLQRDELDGSETRTQLRLLGTCLNEHYGTGKMYDSGQVKSHINVKRDSMRYPVKLFIADDQKQFKKD
tara:strand:- start:372 stop:767 length:396 start_codon:yes stop_codon:yes gene_type:complete